MFEFVPLPIFSSLSTGAPSADLRKSPDEALNKSHGQAVSCMASRNQWFLSSPTLNLCIDRDWDAGCFSLSLPLSAFLSLFQGTFFYSSFLRTLNYHILSKTLISLCIYNITHSPWSRPTEQCTLLEGHIWRSQYLFSGHSDSVIEVSVWGGG